jgi:hypothetical protein
MLTISDFRPFFLNKSHFTKTIPNKNETKPHANFDTLFWCFYILKHGYAKYEILLQTLSIIIEKQIKIEFIEQIRLNKSTLSPFKSKPFSHYEDQLANMDHIDLYTFFLLCHLEHINIVYIVHKCFYSTYDLPYQYIDIVNNNNPNNDLQIPVKINTNINTITRSSTDESDTDESELSDIDDIDSEQSVDTLPVLTKEPNGTYYLKYTKSSEIKWNTLCKIDKLHQPIPPISYFNLPRLQQIYGKLYNTIPSNQKKQEIYNELKEVVKLI